MAKRLAKGAVVFGFGSYATTKIDPHFMPKVIVVHARFAPAHVHLGPQWHCQLPLARGSVSKAWQKVARLEWHNQAIEGMGWGHATVSEDCHGPWQKIGPAAQNILSEDKGHAKG